MGWGSSTARGGGRKVRALPLNLPSLGLEARHLGCPGNVAGMSRTPGGVQKVRAKKVRAHFSFPKSPGGNPPQRGSPRGPPKTSESSPSVT